MAANERLDPEFVGPLVEVQTAPHGHESTLRRELQRTLRSVLRTGDERGRRLVPLGTPLTAASPPATGTRGKLFERIL